MASVPPGVKTGSSSTTTTSSTSSTTLKQWNAKDFRDTIVKPALEKIDRWSLLGEMLVMGTAAQESGLYYTRQLGNGPARGYFQMEPATHDDCWTNYLKYRASLKALVLKVRSGTGVPKAEEMETDHIYAAVMCRVRYMRVRESMPSDANGLARYWKQYYNTPLGAGTLDEFRKNWNRLLSGLYPSVT